MRRASVHVRFASGPIARASAARSPVGGGTKDGDPVKCGDPIVEEDDEDDMVRRVGLPAALVCPPQCVHMSSTCLLA